MPIATPSLLKATSVDATGQASIAMTLAAGKSAAIGDLVVVHVGFGLASTPTITCADNRSNTYTKDRQVDKTTNNTPHSAIFSTVLTTALTTGDTITVSFGSNVNYPIAHSYKIVASGGLTWPSPPVDQTNGNFGASTSPSSGNITTTVADEVLFGVNCVGSGAISLTAGSGWTILDHNNNTTKGLDSQYRIETSTQTRTSDGTMTSADWAMLIASYKTSSGSTDKTITGVRATATAAGKAGTPKIEVTGTRASGGAAGKAGTPTVVVTGARAAATAAAAPGTPKVAVTGARGGASAAGNPGTPRVVVTGPRATATAAGRAGTPRVIVAGARALATATGKPGTVSTGGGSANKTIVGVRALCTAEGRAGAPHLRVTGPRATATCAGRAGSPRVIVTGVRAATTAAGKPGTFDLRVSGARALCMAYGRPGGVGVPALVTLTSRTRTSGPGASTILTTRDGRTRISIGSSRTQSRTPPTG